jgi:hypothetical protein
VKKYFIEIRRVLMSVGLKPETFWMEKRVGGTVCGTRVHIVWSEQRLLCNAARNSVCCTQEVDKWTNLLGSHEESHTSSVDIALKFPHNKIAEKRSLVSLKNYFMAANGTILPNEIG